MKRNLILAVVFTVTVFTSCKRNFQAIDYGKEACAHCKMTIMDKKFAAEIVDKKGKAYKFDDLICMKDFALEKNLNEQDLLLFVADYKNPDNILDLKKAFLLWGSAFKSPMNGGLAAFASQQEAADLQQQASSQATRWNSLK